MWDGAQSQILHSTHSSVLLCSMSAYGGGVVGRSHWASCIWQLCGYGRDGEDSCNPYFGNFESQLWKGHGGASLVAQWLRIRLPMQGTQVQALVWEDPTCHGTTKPVRHNYWACALEPASHNYWARVPQLLKPVHLEPMLRNKRSHRNEKPAHCNEE